MKKSLFIAFVLSVIAFGSLYANDLSNVKHFDNGDFSEVSHRDCDGDTGILNILKLYT